MINLEVILLKLVSELKNKDFFEAVKNAGLNESEVSLVLDAIYDRGE